MMVFVVMSGEDDTHWLDSLWPDFASAWTRAVAIQRGDDHGQSLAADICEMPVGTNGYGRMIVRLPNHISQWFYHHDPVAWDTDATDGERAITLTIPPSAQPTRPVDAD